MLFVAAMVAGALPARGDLKITVEKGIVQLPPHSLMIVQGKQADLKEKALHLGTLQPDLVTPQVAEGVPAPGRRVRQFNKTYEGSGVYHLLYLPEDWVKEKKYPVIVEYAGNQVKGICPGTVEGSNLGYGISAGKEVIWICMPFVDSANRQNADTWWGDTEATVDYCKQTVRRICEEYGGDSSNVFLAGFSRGAIACNFIGLHDDDIASLWRGFIAHSHYEGIRKWPGSTPEGARERVKRLKDKPQFISHEQTADKMIERVRHYLGREHPGGTFTFLELPFPDHTDTWVLRDVPERKLLREWFHAVLGEGQ
jgi:hypothetical protein